MPAWSSRRIHGRARALQVTRWYSALAPSIATADAAKTAAATSLRPSSVLTNTAPTAQATTKPAWCSVPRSSGRGGQAVSDTATPFRARDLRCLPAVGDDLPDPGVRLLVLDPARRGDLGSEQPA